MEWGCEHIILELIPHAADGIHLVLWEVYLDDSEAYAQCCQKFRFILIFEYVIAQFEYANEVQ